MANWAIVIGIDQYWTSEACLKGAVRDALQMRSWLLDVNGGNVLRSNLTLLLGPSPTSSVPAGLQYSDATHDTIIRAIDLLVRRSGGEGERLFFYYAGHGLTTRIQFSDEEALIPSDFTSLLTDKALMFRSICEYFETTQFNEQFFFFDACRNIPWEGQEIVISPFPRPRKRDPSLPAVQQFIFFATSPGVKAAEILEAGNEQGAFTAALLDGLTGKGSAKVWNEYTEEYVITAGKLIEFLESEIEIKRQSGSNQKLTQLIQVPRLAGEHGGSDGTLAHFRAGDFPPETLSVYLEPSSVVSLAEVSVNTIVELVDRKTQIAGLPISFMLPPRDYSVRATALNHEPFPKYWIARLYSPQQFTFKLTPKSSAAHSPAAATPGAASSLTGQHDLPNAQGISSERFVESILQDFTGNVFGETLNDLTDMKPASSGKVLSGRPRSKRKSRPRTRSLIVETGDPLAPLEVTDNLGKIHMAGQGRLVYRNPEPGFYHARLLTPENQVLAEKLLEFSPNEPSKKVRLHPPKPVETRLTQEVIESANLKMLPDNTLQVLAPSKIGHVSSPELSTILTLVGGAATTLNHPDWSDSSQLRSLGLRSFRGATSSDSITGLQVLFGIESRTPEEALVLIAAMKLRLWSQDEPVPEAFEHPVNFSEAHGLAEFTRATQIGPHWFSVELPQQKPVVFALTMLPERLTMLVFQLDVYGKARIFQYLPSLNPYNESESDPESLRRLELLQRYYLSGRLDHVSEGIEELLKAKWIDPIAGCLGGYLALRQGNLKESSQRQQLGRASSNMIGFYSELSDSYVLNALSIAHMVKYGEVSEAWIEYFIKRQEPEKEFYNALERGLPIFADGLEWLLDGIEQYNINHPRAALLDKVTRNRARGLLWSAWSPDDFSPGEVLI